ncbi:hypothetical protein PQX77_000022 [Marasmius sp. AFHP31]|nr:hypothetical protein PQX77_000022 [Marasmius sp. AFHP31]
MAPSRLFNLLALTTVAILASTYGAEPVNALSGHGPLNGKAHHALVSRGHGSMIKKKRTQQQKRCKAREQNGDNSGTYSGNDGNSGGDNNGGNTNGGGNNTTNGGNANGGNSNTDGNSGGNQGGAQASGGNANDSGKVCLAWPNGNDPALANFQTSSSGVIYTWSPFKPENTYGYKFAPMLWGEKQINDFTAQVHAGNFEYVMGFNEPEMDGQSKLTPQRGAELWKQYIQPLASSGAKLVTPGVTSAPQSKPWMVDFFKACDGCTFDAVSVHYYGTSADDLITYITDFHNTFQKPIWLTEYACQNFSGGAQCSPDDIKNFMDKVKKFAEETEWVHQYCWFGAMHDMVDVNPNNQLMDPAGKPTPLGLDFLGLKA